MRKHGRVVNLLTVISFSVALAACSSIVRNHGYAPSDEQLQEVLVGVDTRDTVAEVVGQPSTAGVVRDDAWYYVASRRETNGWRAPQETDRQVVAISFDGNGTVSNVERFTLQDGRVIALNRRVTDDNVKGITFLRQLLGNLGNFNAEDVLNN